MTILSSSGEQTSRTSARLACGVRTSSSGRTARRGLCRRVADQSAAEAPPKLSKSARRRVRERLGAIGGAFECSDMQDAHIEHFEDHQTSLLDAPLIAGFLRECGSGLKCGCGALVRRRVACD